MCVCTYREVAIFRAGGPDSWMAQPAGSKGVVAFPQLGSNFVLPATWRRRVANPSLYSFGPHSCSDHCADCFCRISLGAGKPWSLLWHCSSASALCILTPESSRPQVFGVLANLRIRSDPATLRKAIPGPTYWDRGCRAGRTPWLMGDQLIASTRRQHKLFTGCLTCA